MGVPTVTADVNVAVPLTSSDPIDTNPVALLIPSGIPRYAPESSYLSISRLVPELDPDSAEPLAFIPHRGDDPV